MAVALVAATPPALQEATKISTSVWQSNLQSLFHNTKDRFPDVVWELSDKDDSDVDHVQVWGHKAIVYARAPPSFQARYFSFRPAPTPSYSSSLTLPDDISRSPSPMRVDSPSPPQPLLRLSSSITPALFSNELEYLYTGQGFGEAFEFLYDTSEAHDQGDAEEIRIDKLRKDLVFMWRSRLYSDIRIALTGITNNQHENATAIFSSHRFILASRSPYFYDALIAWPSNKPPPTTLTLPSPPFTPASLHFTLGFIYTGTLIFSHRTYDLDTAFHILRSATYLCLQSLYDEIQARIVQEMLHGLFHAFLEFSEYERITAGKWGTGGCRCRQCARRVPRVLEFALMDDVKNKHLERGARRALVGLFGEGWCTSEFAALAQPTKNSVLKGVGMRTTPPNVFPLLFAAEHAIKKLAPVIDAWAEGVREMILSARKKIAEVLCDKSDECFAQREWLDIMESDGVRFEDGERVEWVMKAVKDGLNDGNAAIVYQTLVSAILLHPHPTIPSSPMLPSTSHIRVQVEETRLEVLKWIRKRWLGIKQQGGFDTLEGWAVKEISHDTEIPVEDLLSPPTPNRSPRPTTTTPSKPNVDEASSLRASVLSRNRNRNPSSTTTPPRRTGTAPSVRSTYSVASNRTTTTSKSHQHADHDRPDSKLTPSSPSIVEPEPELAQEEEQDVSKETAQDIEEGETESGTTSRTGTLTRASGSRRPMPKTLVAPAPGISGRASRASTSTSIGIGGSPGARPKSTASSITSVRSHASTIRKSGAATGTGLLRPPPSRPTSRVSTASDGGSTAFKTAESRSRRTSAASVSSTNSARPRKTSTTSIASTATTATVATSGSRVKRTPPVPSPVVKSPSTGAVKKPTPSITPSVRSVSSPAATKRVVSTSTSSPAVRKSGVIDKKVSTPTASRGTVKTSPSPATTSKPKTSVVEKAKEKGKGPPVQVEPKTRAETLVSDHKKSNSVISSGSAATLKRKGSSDTITKGNTKSDWKEPAAKDGFPLSSRGATLEIGIPCIISSKRKRFKAFARYIGEVEGEDGPWVGVEVPVGESWAGEMSGSAFGGINARQWNDGTWGGIRYFDIGSGGSEWDYGDDRAAVMRRIEWVSSKTNSLKDSKGYLKREGDQLTVDRAKRFRSVSPAASDVSNAESRGLFVRPQQVLYVVDAVGSDL